MADLKAKAELTLSWVKGAQDMLGGICAYRIDGKDWADAYCEVTGYLIPTLVKWGEVRTALRCADYLVEVQNPNGSFNGLNSECGAFFDTGACLEGLQVAWELTLSSTYRDAASRAKDWMRRHITDMLARNMEIYQARPSALVGGESVIEAWLKPKWDRPLRSHYLAYWLEGVHRMGGNIREIADGLTITPPHLIPFEYSSGWEPVAGRYDLCATSQFAALFGSKTMVEAVAEHVRDDGGVPLDPARSHEAFSWCAKFFLDAVFAVTHA